MCVKCQGLFALGWEKKAQQEFTNCLFFDYHMRDMPLDKSPKAKQLQSY